ncbi:MAG: hypothetical protein KJ069_28100 [Anaerolineae bacterium]|nr:hypothetical protein [Anaerolineae bacterium]
MKGYLHPFICYQPSAAPHKQAQPLLPDGRAATFTPYAKVLSPPIHLFASPIRCHPA